MLSPVPAPHTEDGVVLRMIWELQHPFSVLTAPLTPTALWGQAGNDGCSR